MSLKKSVLIASSLFVLAVQAPATLADGKALYTTKACGSCHGPDAKSPIMPIYPKLAGQNKDYALNQMKDIKSGKRSNGQSMVMKGIIAGVSDKEMEEIAAWLATIK